MKKPLLLTIIYLLFFIFGCQSINAQTKFSFIDQEILGIQIGNDNVERLTELYGKGVDTLSGEGKCYFNSIKNEYIIFDLCEDLLICGVTLSKNDSFWDECKEKRIRHRIKN